MSIEPSLRSFDAAARRVAYMALLLGAVALPGGARAESDPNSKQRIERLEEQVQVLAEELSRLRTETAVPEERGRIAGVFVERLRRGMRLQTDPTVIYGIGAAFDGNLRRRDLDRDTPYNTYTRKGLPPTPIANPGTASIDAVMHPTIDGSLYFVAKGDGSHHFSATYEEHNQAVTRYQLRRRSGSSKRGG